jgi:vitamin B12 transporter
MGNVLKYRIFPNANTGALCVLSALGVHASAALADTALDQSTDSSLDEVVVVANRAPEPLSKIGNSVSVLTDADIKASQLTVVSDLLAQTPGITFSRDGGVGQPTSVYIRGAESDQTVVLIDGVQINDPSEPAGGFNFANLLTSNISRIEILRGAQSTLYGSQAMGGVINIVTTEPTTPFGGDVDVEGGSHDTGYFSGGIGGKDDSLMWRLSGNWYGSSGIPAFDEKLGGTRLSASQIGGGSGQVRYNFTPDLDLDIRGYYTQARADFDGYDTPTGAFGNDNEYGTTSQFVEYTGLTLRSPDHGFTNRVAFQYTDTDTKDYDPDAPANYGSPSPLTFYGTGNNEREEYQGTWEFAPQYQAVFGAQHERSTINTYSPEFPPAPPPLEEYATIDSGYVQLQGEVASGLTLTAGDRYDRHNVYGGHSTDQVAAAWALNDGHTILRASFGQGFKAPSLYQLYSNYGNPALRPELSHSWDAGVEQHALDGRLMLSATYFQSASRDLIEFFYCTTPSPLCAVESYGYYANISREAAHGVELQATYNPTPALTLSANYTLTDTQDLSPGSTTYGFELPLRPKNAANASAGYQWSSQWNTAVTLRYSGPSMDYSFGDAAGNVDLGGYVLADLKASYSVSNRLELYARIENVAGKHYETVYEYGTLSRVAYAGLRATF